MGEDRGLGDAGRAPGVLQEGNVVRSARDRLEVRPAAERQRRAETNRFGQRVRRHLPAHVPEHEIDQRTLRQAEQVTDAGDEHVADRGVADDGGQVMGRLLEDDDGDGAGVLELMGELAVGVQRVGVDDRQAGAQRAEHRDRVLQDVRHHQGDAVTRDKLQLLLQVGGEVAAECVEFTERDRPAEAGVGLAVGVADECLVDQFHERRVAGRVDLGRDVGRIGA